MRTLLSTPTWMLSLRCPSVITRFYRSSIPRTASRPTSFATSPSRRSLCNSLEAACFVSSRTRADLCSQGWRGGGIRFEWLGLSEAGCPQDSDAQRDWLFMLISCGLGWMARREFVHHKTQQSHIDRCHYVKASFMINS